MIRNLLAAALALLAVAPTAHAATIVTDYLDLNYGNGYQLIGDLSIEYGKFDTLTQAPTLYFDGSPLSASIFSPGSSGTALYILSPPNNGVTFLDLSVPYVYSYIGPLSFYKLDGVVPVSGTVSYIGETGAPLPPALPLFASGIAALGAIAWRKRGKLSTVRQ